MCEEGHTDRLLVDPQSFSVSDHQRGRKLARSAFTGVRGVDERLSFSLMAYVPWGQFVFDSVLCTLAANKRGTREFVKKPGGTADAVPPGNV